VSLTYGGSSALVSPREDIGIGFDAIDLEALRGGYVGFQIAPLIEAKYAFGQFRKMLLAQFLQPRKTERTADGGFARIEANFDKADFKCESHGLEMRVDNGDANMYAEMVDSDMVAAELTRHGVIEAHEQRVIALAETLSGANTGAAANEFDDDAADIVKDFDTYRETFRMQCGFYPNALVADASMVDALMRNGSVQDKFVGSSDRTARAVTLKGLASALNLEEIIPANSVKNTVANPKAISLSTTWPQAKALLLKKSTSNSLLDPQFARTIHWSGNGSRPGCAFEEYPDPRTDARILRHRLDVDEVLVYASMGYMLTGVKTA